MIITLLMDNPNSWFVPFAKDLEQQLARAGHDVVLIHDIADMRAGDLAFFLSCENIIRQSVRDKHTHNLVVHSSPLPKGKGWSPMTWTILSGENTITNTLFEAVDAVDAGVIYCQNTVTFDGHELLDELRDGQGKGIVSLIVSFVSSCPTILSQGKEQSGDETFYKKRTPADSELAIDKTIAEQFDLMRVADNERYPLFFMYKGKRYTLTISQSDT